MGESPLKSLNAYSSFVAELFDRATIARSNVIVWSDSPYTGIAEGEVYFVDGLRLRMREELDFDAGLITSYGYEVYRGEEKLFWYDDFPHPNDAAPASSFPHHKHVPPDIKRHRIPAPEMSFARPNLAVLISEVESLIATP
ncbi:hypothetical protein HUU05_08795 [candidate division KSB1 bacterium]|nr:hypothetical protein [candidate division KSB1 bacterium]